MTEQQLLALARQGADTWNAWREQHPNDQIDLNGIDLHGVDLSYINLSGTNLSYANLTETLLFGADLSRANLDHANLDHANLSRADLGEANLSEANLHAADLSEANLRRTRFSRADMSGANLMDTFLVETNFQEANLSGCFVYGLSAWNVHLEGAKQSGIIVTHPDEPTVAVGNFELAQFLYFLLSSQEARSLIQTITLKALLVLGKFSPGREGIADVLQEVLLTHGYMPIQCGLEKYDIQDYRTRESLLNTIEVLAPMCRCMIVDLTGASDFLEDLNQIIPYLWTPILPLHDLSEPPITIATTEEAAHMVLPTQSYADSAALRAIIEQEIIEPLEREAIKGTGT